MMLWNREMGSTNTMCYWTQRNQHRARNIVVNKIYMKGLFTTVAYNRLTSDLMVG